MGRRVFVVGVGMTKFEKPGSTGKDYPDFARKPAERALRTRHPYTAIEQRPSATATAFTCGQRAVYQLGCTASRLQRQQQLLDRSTALFMAKQFVEGGLAECVLALGFEKMEKGSHSAPNSWTASTPWTSTSKRWSRSRVRERAADAAVLRQTPGRDTWRSTATARKAFAKIGHKNHNIR